MDLNFFAYLEKIYRVNINKIQTVRNAYKLETDKGYVILKIFHGSEQEMIYVTSVINHLMKSEFKLLAPVLSTVEDTFYIKYKDKLYYLQYYLTGRESDFSNEEDLIRIIQTLAHFHNNSFGLFIPEPFANNNWGNLDEIMYSRLIYMYKITENTLSLGHNEDFDNLFQKWFPYFAQESIDAIDLLQKSSYQILSLEYQNKRFFCHHDLVNHNIIIGSDHKAHLIDFDYSVMDIRVHDLCNLLNHVMKVYWWDMDIAKKILFLYDKINPLHDKEIKVLHALLNYPINYWQEAYFYYREPIFSSKRAFQRLKSNIQLQKARRHFLDNFISAM